MNMHNDRHISRDKVYYASETIILDLRLRKRAEMRDLSNVDIVLEFTTGQLGPRRFAGSLHEKAGLQTTTGVRIYRYTDHYAVQLQPEFLQTLYTGFLTITARYHTPQGDITNRIPLHRFINDMPVETFQPTDAEKTLGSCVRSNNYKFLEQL